MADLISVEVETTLEARYVFPDMPRDTLTRALQSDVLENGQFVLVNVSHASLVMPMRIVKHIKVGGEVIWRRGK